MQLKEKISKEEFRDPAFNAKLGDASEYGKAVFTHYLHNHKNGVSKFYKNEAVSHVKSALEYKFPEENITSEVAEEALQYMLFDFKEDIPFPKPKNPKFKFIDLFAGIGGFRLALQNLHGKCAGFEYTRGTLFFDVAEIIKNTQPKAIFLENVKGLRNHDKGKTLATILNVLREDLDYFVPEPQVINAKEFEVPYSQAFCSNLFVRSSQKGLPQQFLTQKAA